MTSPLVLILYNQPLLPEDHPDADSEYSIVEIAESMAEIFRDRNYGVAQLGLKPDPSMLWQELDRIKPDVVFNLYEGTLDDPETESYITGLLQWKGIPYTGSPFQTLTLCRNKHLTKLLLRGAKLPSSDFFTIDTLPAPKCPLDWPVIVKPAAQDASVGVDQESVCTSQEQLEGRARYIYETYGPPVLVEEYLPGREFNVAVLELPELEYLPPAEIMFPEQREGYWPILTYDGKWRPGTPDYETIPPKYPAEISKQLARKMGTLALKAYRLLGCRDYARIDFRLKPNGKLYILEVNPNPEISEHAGFAGCLGSAKITHADFVCRILEQALSRRDAAKPTLKPKERAAPTLTPTIQ